MDELLILRAEDVVSTLGDDMAAVVESVAEGYLTLHRGLAVMPPSPFLRFVEGRPERIIGLPAYLKGQHPIVGIKWIASFPGNLSRGIDRASAVIVCNDLETGRPDVILEGAIISATRTAASAALAARELHPGVPDEVGVIGCGPIAWQTLRYLRTVGRLGRRLAVVDLDPARGQAFAEKAVQAGLVDEWRAAPSSVDLMEQVELSVLATSAILPHLDPQLRPEQTVLHLSLRDLSTRCVAQAANTTDAVEHVLQAGTSLHLASEELGHHRFITGTLAQVLEGEAPARVEGQPAIFSPFGMGVLDLAVAGPVIARCRAAGRGVKVPSFFGSAWAG
jgi:ornithine cyclodeaminase